MCLGFGTILSGVNYVLQMEALSTVVWCVCTVVEWTGVSYVVTLMNKMMLTLFADS